MRYREPEEWAKQAAIDELEFGEEIGTGILPPWPGFLKDNE